MGQKAAVGRGGCCALPDAGEMAESIEIRTVFDGAPEDSFALESRGVGKDSAALEALLLRLQHICGRLDASRDQDQIYVRPGTLQPGEPELSGYCILDGVQAEDRHSLVADAKKLRALDRCMGSLCGMAIGDSLGHPFEFIPANDEPGGSYFDIQTKEFHGEFNKFRLKPGQWTDDTAMGLCMADSLIMRKSFDGSDMRIRFWCWWFQGYNNGFHRDEERSSKRSIGLGGNVASSLMQLAELEGDEKGRIARVPPVYEADRNDAGNGSVMRLAPLPIFFCSAPASELHSAASLSSTTTHPGIVAGQACAVLAHLIVRALTLPDCSKVDIRGFLDEAVKSYLEESDLKNNSGPGYDEVKQLLRSKPEREEEGCWDWKGDRLQVESTLLARAGSYNGYPSTADYFGSYSLDSLAVALWCVYHTSSFDEAVVRAANVLGDADSIASVAGQIAGAFYGYSSIDRQFLEWLNTWDESAIAVRALLLYNCGREEYSSSSSANPQ